LNIEPRTTSGATGTLDVLVDGKIIFSHQAEHRMPGSGEIVALIRARQGATPA